MQLQKVETSTKECNRVVCSNRQDLSKLRLPALTLTETIHPPASVIPAHTHEKASICLALAGHGLEIVDGVRIVTEPGCVIMRGPHVTHSNRYGTVPLRGVMIELENKWFETCRPF